MFSVPSLKHNRKELGSGLFCCAAPNRFPMSRCRVDVGGKEYRDSTDNRASGNSHKMSEERRDEYEPICMYLSSANRRSSSWAGVKANHFFGGNGGTQFENWDFS